MALRTDQQTEREVKREQAHREELVERIARDVRHDETTQPLSGLHPGRVSSPPQPVHGAMEPSVCVIAQGSKELLLRESR